MQMRGSVKRQFGDINKPTSGKHQPSFILLNHNKMINRLLFYNQTLKYYERDI